MTVELSTQELAAELARRQQTEQQEQQRQADTIREAQQDWSRALLTAHKEREAELEAEGTASMAAAEKAISEGDLAGAYFNYTGWHAARMARYYLRTHAQSAVNRVPDYRGGNITDLRIVDSDFHGWLNNQVHKLAERDGAARFEEILGADIPTNYEGAKAWLDGNQA